MSNIGYSSTYNVGILDYFNPEVQLKDTESAIKNKLKDLFTELNRLKIVTTLALEFKKIQNDEKTRYSVFYLPLEVEIIFNKKYTDMNINQFIIQFY